MRTTFGSFSLASLRLGRQALFTCFLILAVGVALWFSQSWPPAARFVPHAAAYAALFFAALNLATEIFAPHSTRAAMPQQAHGATAELTQAEPLPVRIMAQRAARYFGWLVGFLIAGAAIGMLPALFLFVVLQMRLEFRERWGFSLAASCIATFLLWLLFDRTFALPWPQSLLGDILPALRDASGLV
jgi:hypothetical protein